MTGEKQKFYNHGKIFESFDDMEKYSQEWPDEPLDLEHFRKFLDDRFKEALINKQLDPSITNRTMYRLLRLNTDWVAIKGEFPE